MNDAEPCVFNFRLPGLALILERSSSRPNILWLPQVDTDRGGAMQSASPNGRLLADL